MTDTVVVEGQVKIRDGKKWKSRWVLLRKPSPVADCLSLLVYKDKSDKSKGHRERSSLTLGDICGLEPGLSYEGIGYTLAIVCLAQTVLLGFESRESLLAWELHVRYSLGEVHRFNVHVQPGTKLDPGPATLHLCNNLLVITRDHPPVIAGQWKLSDLRRYGAVPNGFVFEGGTRCGYWTGVFFLACAEGEQISFLFDCVVRGISPTRSPFGLRPVLPDPNWSPSLSEEKIRQDASELEKRLSLLSASSRHSSTASTSSYTFSIAGDNHSISSSSSENSHSDASLGSRLALWAESTRCPPPTNPPPPSSTLGTSSAATAKQAPPSSAEEQLYAAIISGCSTRPRLPAQLPRPRGLQEAGRQSSTDSGIATTGSHSSYSGSFSSYTGSLDMGAETEDFGSLLSLPSIPSLAPSIPNSSALELNSCCCETPAESLSKRLTNSSEYLVPLQIPERPQTPRYDTPRKLLLGTMLRDLLLTSGSLDIKQNVLHQSHSDTFNEPKVPSSLMAMSGVSRSESSVAHQKTPGASCPGCGGIKGAASSHGGELSAPSIPGEFYLHSVYLDIQLIWK
uniref:Docking protein 7 n=1 Tax=Denticeps clupeoides TaxID=299321 RepID=A0AAY4ATI5_9TELE